jgi:DNA polymerase (family X)
MPESVDRFTLAARLREIAAWLSFRGDRAYRVRAFERGARAVIAANDLERLIAEGRLTELPGIGNALAAQIEELHASGGSQYLDRLRDGLPPGLASLFALPGLSPKRIVALHRALGIGGRSDLEAALAAGRLSSVPGFGDKTVRKIAEGLARGTPESAHRLIWVKAEELALALCEHLRAHADTVQVAPAGALRRCQETIGELDLVVASTSLSATRAHFARLPSQAELPVRLHVVPPEQWFAALHRCTGSQAHLARLEALAQSRGMRLPGEPRSEAEIYRALGLAEIPPELREDQGEIEEALLGGTFDDLVRIDHVRGLIHCHTVYSDGKNTIEEMAGAAAALGMSYLSITDHSAAAHYAGGLEVARLSEQWREIAAVQARVPVRILRGTEADILRDGSLDCAPEMVPGLDVLIASVHARFKLDSAEMTARVSSAMRQPVFKIWGHPLGRILLHREPFDCDVEAILDAAAQSRAAVEINGDPWRLDLEPRWVRQARKRGLRFVLSTDAHSTGALHNLRHAVSLARRGGVRRHEVLNTLTAERFVGAVRPHG